MQISDPTRAQPGDAAVLAGHRIERTACMGGWCRIRETCALYLATDAHRVLERACEPGADGIARVAFVPREIPRENHPTDGSWPI